MRGEREVHVEQHEAHPGGAVAHGVGRVTVQAVEVQREHRVWRHGHHVRHGQPRQDDVKRRHHVPPRQHHDVKDVTHDAEDTDAHGHVTMDLAVPLIEGVQVLCPVLLHVFLNEWVGFHGDDDLV